MARWNVYYFDSLDPNATPSRETTIEASSEEQAGRIAVATMGRSMRVYVTRPFWEAATRSRPTNPSAQQSEAFEQE
jgi:hypothetical protein